MTSPESAGSLPAYTAEKQEENITEFCSEVKKLSFPDLTGRN